MAGTGSGRSEIVTIATYLTGKSHAVPSVYALADYPDAVRRQPMLNNPARVGPHERHQGCGPPEIGGQEEAGPDKPVRWPGQQGWLEAVSRLQSPAGNT
jgi:hypothetical protein